jgi:colanic acid/amylovoran biosynthesis glycosyltransferase
MILEEYPDLFYYIIGDGRLRGKLDSLIKDLDCASNIKILGSKTNKDIIRLINSSHILLAPSIKAKDGDGEGIPNVLKEAMAVGLPVITSDNFGIPELVRDGFSGYLIPEGDIDAMAEKLIFLINNEKIRKKMGINGRKHIEECYDIKKLNLKLLDIYKRVFNGV